MEQRDSVERSSKKAYAKPELRQVSLRPEEAVLGACKTATHSGPSQPSCTAPFNCNAIKS